jgi:hypothetical protein
MAQILELRQAVDEFEDLVDLFHVGVPQRGAMHGATLRAGYGSGNGQFGRVTMKH